MKQKYRIKKNEDFQTVIHKGHFEKSKSFLVYYYHLDSKMNYPRIGISAPVKLGKAVVRTTIRRQIRGMINEMFDEIDNNDYVIIVRPNYNLNNYEKNRADLHELFVKIRRKKNEKNT